ncbi:hypothetical protein LSG31_20100 [Fodinisporobacter ferrooxydans]|uniref:Type 4 fimbrial biogenesis protein PilX N-terminal domain-containing protein n=1 Tax=Fodinisporobacter ferrooxydans TaxID=2901836 RepID=A0ABY4CHX7_9BACL|nr:hypothetical protein LSG31_20100 [Alicyclobacillaceae bacterium MYW30-H2]
MAIRYAKGLQTNEQGFISLFTLAIMVVCLTLAGFLITDAEIQNRQVTRTEQMLKANVLAQDALELGKQKLDSDRSWRGTSDWIARENGNCQYTIQSDPQPPLWNSLQAKNPTGVMIKGMGKTADGSLRIILIWYDSTTRNTYAYMHA